MGRSPLLALAWAAVALARNATDRPNFVMLFVDDFGYGDTGFNNASVATPNIDRLAFNGKILTTWYSGCPVCTGARAALMTGRQYARAGIGGGIGPSVKHGLALEETTLAEQLKKAKYATAAVGKWHLGQREVYMPGNRGFDHYLGIPYSNDMGFARLSSCAQDGATAQTERRMSDMTQTSWDWKPYYDAGFIGMEDVEAAKRDAGSMWVPLVRQDGNKTEVLEQPTDLTTLSERYSDFAVDFIEKHKREPFFLYVPFSHIHAILPKPPTGEQYSGCRFRGKSKTLGPLGDALLEVDWLVGNVHRALQDAGILENTLILFTGDNGAWLDRKRAGGSVGVLTGSYAGYGNVGKGSTWEGGIRSASFAYWKGQIEPRSRSGEIISSLDVFPTLSKLAKVPLNASRVLDGRDMSEVLLQRHGKSKHEFLFFYGGCGTWKESQERTEGPSAVRHGQWKAHFCTGPGLGGCERERHCEVTRYSSDAPLLFDVVKDPGESTPVNTTADAEAAAALSRIVQAYRTERATFKFGAYQAEPDRPGEEGGHEYGICCDRGAGCYCPGATQEQQKEQQLPPQSEPLPQSQEGDDVETARRRRGRHRKKPVFHFRGTSAGGILSIGTGHFHDDYHEVQPEHH